MKPPKFGQLRLRDFKSAEYLSYICPKSSEEPGALCKGNIIPSYPQASGRTHQVAQVTTHNYLTQDICTGKQFYLSVDLGFAYVIDIENALRMLIQTNDWVDSRVLYNTLNRD